MLMSKKWRAEKVMCVHTFIQPHYLNQNNPTMVDIVKWRTIVGSFTTKIRYIFHADKLIYP